MEKKENKNIKRAILRLNGANCSTCVYAIEHLGRKVNGVSDIVVNAGEQKIYVNYNGDIEPLEKIRKIVLMLGYDAEIELRHST